MQFCRGPLLSPRHERPGVKPERGLLVRAEARALDQLEVDVVDRGPVAHPPADLVQDRRTHLRLPSGTPGAVSLTKRPGSTRAFVHLWLIDSARGMAGRS